MRLAAIRMISLAARLRCRAKIAKVMSRLLWLGLCLLASALAYAQPSSAAPPVTLRHALWDANQRPLYQACARAFEAAHPGIRIRIQQMGWGDYWTGLATGFVSATAPDVFTHHPLFWSEYLLNGVMADLSNDVARDGVKPEDYERGLLAMWQHQGRSFGLPLDWDTVALAVNLEHMERAGLTLQDLINARWNPRDGGSFERIIRRLTQDQAGRRADEAGFDPQKVRLRGFQISGPGGMLGQTEWSSFAVSAGWRYQSQPGDAALRYDDPVFIDTLRWFASLPSKGLSAAPKEMGKMGAEGLFLAGRVAMVPAGAWMTGHFQQHAKFRYAWVPLPVGPNGQRASMVNSLALSVWSGSKHREAAWRWVRYVGSRECQAQIAQQGVVYPAIRGLGAVAAGVQRGRGVDTQAFIDAAQGLTFAAPVVPRSAEINDVMNSALESVLSGRMPPEVALPQAAQRARALARER